ncbi:UNVERIFIED_CONTAM: nucleoside-diphosphate-sugar epimerase [Williamsia faeni]
MKILLTGATGYIGGAVLDELIAQGMAVTALVRSAEAAAAVRRRGADAQIVDLFDVARVRDLLSDVDGAIHTASPGDATSGALDAAVIDAVIAAFAGTGKAYIHTSGVWLWGSSAAIVDDSPLDPPAIVAWRVAQERRLLDGAVAATIVAPGIVYGEGGGIPNVIVDAPGAGSGQVSLVGDGSAHWGLVHVRDLAQLYVLALQGNPGGRLIGVSHTASVAELHRAAHPGATLIPTTVEDTRSRLGAAFADALLLDQVVGEPLRASELGWQPNRAVLRDELSAGYRAAADVQPA